MIRFDNAINELFELSVPLHVTAENTALIVVDMQYFDAHPDWGEGRTAKELGVAHHFDEYFAQIEATIPHIQQLLNLFRSKEMEVIHIRVSEVTADSRDVGRKQLVRGFIVPAGSREADFLASFQITEIATLHFWDGAQAKVNIRAHFSLPEATSGASRAPFTA